MYFYWLHIVYTCSLVTIRFSIASSILTIWFYIENGIVEEKMSLTFLM